MLSQDFLETLPGDPEEAFSLLENELRRGIPPNKDFHDGDEQRSFDLARAEHQKNYVVTLAGFALAYDMDIGVDFEELMLLEEYAFINKFTAASVKIQLFANICAFKLNARKRAGSTCIYVLSSAAKVRIRRQIDAIKKILEEEEISDLKRESLLNKLVNFSKEVELDRTRLESVASLYVEVRNEVKTATKLLEPINKLFDSIAKGGKELRKALPEVSITARINAPQKKIEDQSRLKADFDLDDEIPF